MPKPKRTRVNRDMVYWNPDPLKDDIAENVLVQPTVQGEVKNIVDARSENSTGYIILLDEPNNRIIRVNKLL